MKKTRFAALLVLLLGVTHCAPKNNSESESSNSNYYIYVSSGYPTASGTGVVSKWDRYGHFIQVVADYASAPGYMPQGLMSQIINGELKILSLSLATTGRVDSMGPDGSSFAFYFDNTSALIAGTHRIVGTSDGGYLISRTAGVERFNSAKARVGAAAKYGVSGTCASTAVTGVAVAEISGTEYVLSSNAAATPNNKINLYNGTTGSCILGAAPAGPATTMWPVDIEYVPSESKLFVLYYPFTAATTNAQVWSFDVTGAVVNNGTLLFNDTGAEIATISATPQNLSSAISYYTNGSERFVLVGTSNNSVMKLDYNGTSLTKSSTQPLIYASVFARSISDVHVTTE